MYGPTLRLVSFLLRQVLSTAESLSDGESTSLSFLLSDVFREVL
jgi:hypothetical protein